MKPDSLLALIAIVALLIMGIAVIAALLSHGIQSHQRYIMVSALGSVYGTPSEAVMYLTVNGTGNTTEIATANLSLSLARLNGTLDKYISNQSMMTATSYTLGKFYDNSSKLRGYQAVEQLTVTITNADNVSALIGSVSGISNVYIGGVESQFSAMQSNSLMHDALQLAIANATSLAQTAAGNGKVVLQNITINSYQILPLVSFGASAAAAVPNPVYFTGRSEVRESVSAVFSYST